MAVRTHVAVVVILLVAGWIFVSPGQRRFFLHTQLGDESPQTPLTLQISPRPRPSQSSIIAPKETSRWAEDSPPVVQQESHAHFKPQLDFPPDDAGDVKLPTESRYGLVDTSRRAVAAAASEHQESSTQSRWPDVEPVADAWNQNSSMSPLRPSADTRLSAGETWPSDTARPLRPVMLNGSEIGQPYQTGTSPHTNTNQLTPVATMNDSRASRSYKKATATRWHRIVNGDSLAFLAKHYYGDPNLSLVIFERNRSVLVSPEILPIGTELEIPPPPATPGRPLKPLPTE